MFKVHLKNIMDLGTWLNARLDGMQGLADDVAKKVAEEFLRRLKESWYAQDLALAPLSEAYAAAKAREGLDNRILIATGELVSSLEVFQTALGKKRGSGEWTAGVKAGVMHESGIEMAQLMAALEFGSPSNGLPARPVFFTLKLRLEAELLRLAEAEFAKGLAEKGWTKP